MDELLVALEALGVPVWDTDATGADLHVEALPYVLVLGTDGDIPAEGSYCAGDSGGEVRLRHVGASREQAAWLAGRTRSLLDRARLSGAGRVIDYEFTGAGAATTDPDVGLPGTQRHPVFIDHTYRVWSQATN